MSALFGRSGSTATHNRATPSISVRPASPGASGPDPDSFNDDEPPPAYSPIADVHRGEAVVEQGPRRPFQPAPPPRLVPQASGWSPPSTSPAAPAARYQPPPQHPSLSPRNSGWSSGVNSPAPQHPPIVRSVSNPSRPSPSAPLSDFARDFYAALPATDDNGAESSVQYSRPSEPPPNSPQPSTSSRVPKPTTGEGPTTVPTPGRPLLRNGQVLVYDKGHFCKKCLNCGYKNYDPNSPCDKCWKKYGKPFSGPLAYAPWDKSVSGGMQRPLPSFQPPQASRSLTPTTYAPPSIPPQPSSSSSYSPSPSSYGGYNSSYPGSLGRHPSSPAQVGWVNGAPPGATVVRPGDPRIGGRLCWRCGGDGEVSFLIFDTEPCPVCRGCGRTFP